MKYIILLVMFSIFMLGCSSGKSLKSAGEEWAIPEIFSVAEFKEAIIINQETGEVCGIDLRERGELQLPFVSNVAKDDGRDFKEVSILQEPVSCDFQKEQILASLVPEAVYGDLSEEAVAGFGSSFVARAGSHTLSCGLGFLTGEALADQMTPELSFEIGGKTIYIQTYSGAKTLALAGISATWLGVKNYAFKFKPGNYTMAVCGGLGAGTELLVGYVLNDFSKKALEESPVKETDWTRTDDIMDSLIWDISIAYLPYVNLEKSGYSSERDFVRDLLIEWFTMEDLQKLGFSSHEEMLEKVMEGINDYNW